jgi:hypothetical protein
VAKSSKHKHISTGAKCNGPEFFTAVNKILRT